jgi:hypothetical protein
VVVNAVVAVVLADADAEKEPNAEEEVADVK